MALRDPVLKEQRLARLEDLEDRVYEQSAAAVEEFLAFREIRHDQQEPPAQWVAEYGQEEAERRLNLAKAGWLPASISPVGVKVALAAMNGISRARAYKVKVTQNNLNVKIALPAPTTTAHPGPITYEVRDLDP